MAKRSRKVSSDVNKRKSSHDIVFDKYGRAYEQISILKTKTMSSLGGSRRGECSRKKCGASSKNSLPKRKMAKSKRNLSSRADSKSSALPDSRKKKSSSVKKLGKRGKFRPMDTLREDWMAFTKLRGNSKSHSDAKRVNRRVKELRTVSKEESSRISFFSTMMNFKAFKFRRDSEEEPSVSEDFQAMVADFDRQFQFGLQTAGQKFKFRLTHFNERGNVIPYFDSHHGDWNTFSSVLRAFLKMNKTPKRHWNKVLLNSLDSRTYTFLKELCQPEQVHKMTFDELFDILDNHFLSTSEEDAIKDAIRSNEKYSSNTALSQIDPSDKTNFGNGRMQKRILWRDQEVKKNLWNNEALGDTCVFNVKSFGPSLLKLKRSESNVKKKKKLHLPIVKSLESTATPADNNKVVNNVLTVTSILIDKHKQQLKSQGKTKKCQSHESPHTLKKSVTFDPKLDKIKITKCQGKESKSGSRKSTELIKPIKTTDKSDPNKAGDHCRKSKISQPNKSGKMCDNTKMSNIGDQCKKGKMSQADKSSKNYDQVSMNNVGDQYGCKISQPVKSSKMSDQVNMSNTGDQCRRYKQSETQKTNKISDQVDMNKIGDQYRKCKFAEQEKSSKISDQVNMNNIGDQNRRCKLSEQDKPSKIFDQVNMSNIGNRCRRRKLSEKNKSIKISDQVNMNNIGDQCRKYKISEHETFSEIADQGNINNIENQCRTCRISEQDKSSQIADQANMNNIENQCRRHKMLEPVHSSKISDQANMNNIENQCRRHKMLEPVHSSKISDQANVSNIGDHQYRISKRSEQGQSNKPGSNHANMTIIGDQCSFNKMSEPDKSSKISDQGNMDNMEDEFRMSKVSETDKANKIYDQVNMSNIGERKWKKILDSEKANNTLDTNTCQTSLDLLSNEKNQSSFLEEQIEDQPGSSVNGQHEINDVESDFRNNEQFDDMREKLISDFDAEKSEHDLYPFNLKTDNWDEFKQRLNIYLVLEKIPYEKWVDVVMSRLDDDSKKVLKHFSNSEQPEAKTFTEIMAMLDEYFIMVANNKNSEDQDVSGPALRGRTRGVLTFNLKNGDWEEFRKQIEKYMEDTDLPRNQWGVELLSRLDNKTYKFLTYVCDPVPPYKKSYEELIDIFNKEPIILSKDAKEKKKYLEKLEEESKSRARAVSSNEAKFVYDTKSGSWEEFKSKLNCYLETKEVDKARWTFELLSRIDPATYNLLKNKCKPKTALQMSYESLIAIIDSHFTLPSVQTSEEKKETQSNPPSGSSGDWLSLKKSSDDTPNKKIDSWTCALLSGLDFNSYQLLRDECAPDLPEEKRFEELVDILDKFVLSMPSKNKSGPKEGECSTVPTAVEASPKNVSLKINKQVKRKKQGKRTDSLWTLALLNGLNDKVHHLLNALCEPELPNKKSFEEIVDLLDTFLIPMPRRKKKKISHKCSIVNDSTKFFHYSRIPPFNSKRGDWNTYRKSLTVNFELFGIPKDKWPLAFLSKLDDRVFRKLQSICDPVPPHKKPFEDLLSIVDGLFVADNDDKSDALSDVSWISSRSQPPSFSSKIGDWTTFKEELKNTLESCKMTKDKWAETLLKSVDEETYKLLQDLCKPFSPEQKTFDELMHVIDHHFLPPAKNLEDDSVLAADGVQVYHCNQQLSPNSQLLNDKLYNQCKSSDVKKSSTATPKASVEEKPPVKKPQFTAEKPFEEVQVLPNESPELSAQDIKIAHFKPNEETWFLFKQRLIRDLELLKYPKELWNAVLVKKLDGGTLQILREATKPGLPEHRTFEELVSVLDGYFVPQRNLSYMSFMEEVDKQKNPTATQISGFASKIKHWSCYKQRLHCDFQTLGIPEGLTHHLIKGLDDIIYDVLQNLCESQFNLLPFKELCSRFNKDEVKVKTCKKESEKDLRNFPSFDFVTGDWKVYKERLMNHLVLYDVPVDKWTLALLSVLNGDDHQTLKLLCQPTLPESKTFKELMNLLDQFFAHNSKNNDEQNERCRSNEIGCSRTLKDNYIEGVKMDQIASQNMFGDKANMEHFRYMCSEIRTDDQSLSNLRNYLRREINQMGTSLSQDRSRKRSIRRWKL